MIKANEIIEFLKDQSIDKDRLLYELIKHEEKKDIVNVKGEKIKTKKCGDCKNFKDNVCKVNATLNYNACDKSNEYKFWEAK